MGRGVPHRVTVSGPDPPGLGPESGGLFRTQPPPSSSELVCPRAVPAVSALGLGPFILSSLAFP